MGNEENGRVRVFTASGTYTGQHGTVKRWTASGAFVRIDGDRQDTHFSAREIVALGLPPHVVAGE